MRGFMDPLRHNLRLTILKAATKRGRCRRAFENSFSAPESVWICRADR